MSELVYYCDKKRHLVCKPYSIENLHKMADALKIGRQWFHKGIKGRSHYDIPIRRTYEIRRLCRVVSQKDIVRIIRGTHQG